MKENGFVLKVFVLVATGLLLYLLYLVAEPFLMVLVTASVSAVFLNPAYQSVNKKLKGRERLAAGLTITAFLLAVVVPVVLLSMAVAGEVGDVVSFTRMQEENLVRLNERVNEVVPNVYVFGQRLEINISGYAGSILKNLSSQLGRIVGTLGALLVNLFLIVITLFSFLVHQERIINYLLYVIPLEEKYLERVEFRAARIIHGTVKGSLLVILLQTVVGIVGFSLFGGLSLILLGVIFGLLSIVPTVGIALVWIPYVLYLLAVGKELSALGFFSWVMFANLLVDNYIVPRFIGHHTGLHQMVVLFSILGGIQQFGLIGIVLGPMIVAVAFICVELYRELV